MPRERMVRLAVLASLVALLALAPHAASLPVAELSYSPGSPTVGELVTFDGSMSNDPNGWLVEWFWDFGDNATAYGVSATHVYGSPGTFQVTLRVTNGVGERDSASAWVTVQDVPPPDLRPYAHPSGFRMPVPVEWDVHEDEVIEGIVVELGVYAPEWGLYNVLTNVLLDTERDFTVRETETYLDEQARVGFEEILEGSPNAVLEEGPTHRTVSNHSAVSFVVRYVGQGFIQEMVLVVSDAHDRFWIMILTTSEPEYPKYRRTFAVMVEGFEITVEPPAFDIPTVGAVGAALAGTVAALIVALLLRRSGPISEVPVTRPSECPSCGSHVGPTDAFCQECGRPVPVGGEAALRGSP